MALPKLNVPVYEAVLPSTEKVIKYRPFLVKEEKILIIALETKNQGEMTNAVKDVLKKCILTRGVKVDNLPTFDIEFIFLTLRSRSVGEGIELGIDCVKCEESNPVKINLDKVEVKNNDFDEKDNIRDINHAVIICQVAFNTDIDV